MKKPNPSDLTLRNLRHLKAQLRIVCNRLNRLEKHLKIRRGAAAYRNRV